MERRSFRLSKENHKCRSETCPNISSYIFFCLPCKENLRIGPLLVTKPGFLNCLPYYPRQEIVAEKFLPNLPLVKGSVIILCWSKGYGRLVGRYTYRSLLFLGFQTYVRSVLACWRFLCVLGDFHVSE